MKVTLKAIVNNYAIINFDSFLMDGVDDGALRLSINRNELAKLIEKNMKCRVEFPDKSHQEVAISEITRQDGNLILDCRSSK
jgi:hypothetical protein